MTLSRQSRPDVWVSDDNRYGPARDHAVPGDRPCWRVDSLVEHEPHTYAPHLAVFNCPGLRRVKGKHRKS